MNEVVIDCNTVDSKEELLKVIYRGLGFNDYLDVANLDGLYDLMAPNLYPEITQTTIRFRSWNTTIDNVRADWLRAGKTLDVAYIK